MKIKETMKNLWIKIKPKLPIIFFILTPLIFLGLMILVLNYTKIWYYLKPKPIILTFILLTIIHILVTAITRK